MRALHYENKVFGCALISTIIHSDLDKHCQLNQ